MLIFDDDDDADDGDDDLEIDRIRPKQRAPNKTHINIYSSAFVFSNVYTRKISHTVKIMCITIYIISCIRKMHTNTIYYIKYDLIILNYINSIIYIIWNINQWPMSPISRPQNVPRVKTKHQLKRQILHVTLSWGIIPQIKTSKRT